MTYEYKCAQGCKSFDVIKSYREMENPEHCPVCGELAIRKFVPSKIHLTGTKVTHPQFNPGLGTIVKNKRHKEEIMKIRGLEEIGSEPVEKIHKHFDESRETKLDQAYEDATKGWVGNGE